MTEFLAQIRLKLWQKYICMPKGLFTSSAAVTSQLLTETISIRTVSVSILIFHCRALPYIAKRCFQVQPGI